MNSVTYGVVLKNSAKGLSKRPRESDNVVSNPRVQLATFLVMVPLILIFFRPTWLEFLGFYLVDFLSFVICSSFELKLFYRFYPGSELYFPNIRPTLSSLVSLKDRIQLYYNILNFPKNRSFYLIAASAIKVAPAFLYSILTWGSQGTYLLTVGKCLSICAFTFSFSIGMSYLEYHNVMSTALAKIHEIYDWTEVFAKVEINSDKRAWQNIELLCTSVLIIFFLCLVSIIIQDRAESVIWAQVEFAYVSISVLYFVATILYTSRNQVMAGISKIVDNHSEDNIYLQFSSISLSTNPHLAFHQRAINNVVYKSVETQKELHYSMHKLSEDSRFRQIGELTALLAHDSSTHLEIMGLSLQLLRRDQALTLSDDRRFQNLERAFETLASLLENVKTFVREENSSKGIASIIKAYDGVVSLVKIHFGHDTKYKDISFNLDLDADRFVSISQTSLNQIFMNLMINSISNMTSHNVDRPAINIVEVESPNYDNVELLYQDTGTGLSKEMFLNMTERSGYGSDVAGIGLRLISKILKQAGGSIELIESIDDEHGTKFLITLRRYTEVITRPKIQLTEVVEGGPEVRPEA